jgi:hypothetical protein
MAIQVGQRRAVAGVGQRIQRQHAGMAVLHRRTHEVAADESGTAGHEPGLHRVSPVQRKGSGVNDRG